LWNIVALEQENTIAYLLLCFDNPLRGDLPDDFLAGKFRLNDFLLSTFGTFYIQIHYSQVGIN
jgi:hypothetical protein